jgi:hypothetical protein
VIFRKRSAAGDIPNSLAKLRGGFRRDSDRRVGAAGGATSSSDHVQWRRQ